MISKFSFPRRRSQQNRAFTLIELLVIIAIIGLLAAILFPVFVRVRDKARQTSCASNLKQIGMGLLQYQQDYDERLIHPWFSSTQDYAVSGTLAPGTSTAPALNGVDQYTWMDAVYPYVKSNQIFDCRSASFSGGLVATTYQYPASNTHGGSYAMISVYDAGGYSSGGCNSSPCSMAWAGTAAKVVSPAESVWVMDSVSGSGGNAYIFYNVNSRDPNPELAPATAKYQFLTTITGIPVLFDQGAAGQPNVGSNGTASVIAFRHTERSNCLYADGHVKAFDYLALTNARTTASSCQQFYSPFAFSPCYKSLMAY